MLIHRTFSCGSADGSFVVLLRYVPQTILVSATFFLLVSTMAVMTKVSTFPPKACSDYPYTVLAVRVHLIAVEDLMRPSSTNVLLL
jgi:hypothetical protein